MKDLFLINASLPNRIAYYHLLFFFASLPFDRFYSQVILISFTLHILIHLKKSELKAAGKWPVLIVQFAFILTAIGMVYSPDRSRALQELDKQLAIFLFPLLLAVGQLDLAKYGTRLLKGLGLSCAISIVYLYYDAARIIIGKDLPLSALISESFINHNFSSPIHIHATYLSMFAAFSLIYFLTEFLRPGSARRRAGYAILILILFSGIIQLCSKSVFIALIISILSLPFFYFQGIKTLRILSYSSAVCVFITIVIFQIPSLKDHFFTELSKDLSYNRQPEITDSRVTRWGAALRVIAKAPVLGYGSGSEVDILGDEYFSRKLYHSYLKKLNAHNQYLSFAVKFGIAGIAILLFTLGYGFRLALIRRDPLFFAFLVLITVVSFSENILDVNKGIFFYSSMFSLFIFSRHNRADKISLHRQQPLQGRVTY